MPYILIHFIVAFVASTLYLWLIYRNVCWPHIYGWLLCLAPAANLLWAIILACEAINDLLQRRWP